LGAVLSQAGRLASVGVVIPNVLPPKSAKDLEGASA